MNQDQNTSQDIHNPLLQTNQVSEYHQLSELSGYQYATKSILISQIKTHKANIFLTVMTIMKAAIGVGILGLPTVFYRLGYVLGIIVFTLASILNQYSCMLLLKSKNLSRKSNYSTIGYYLENSKIVIGLLYLLFIINNFGVCTAQLTIFKQVIRDIGITQFKLSKQWYIQGYFTVGVVVALVLMPLVLVSRIQKLRFVALIGTFGISIFIVTIFINFFYILYHRDWKVAEGVSALPTTGAWGAIASIPNILFALLYQINFYPIFKGMENPTDKRMLKASSIATLNCYLFYLTIGLLGYFAYGKYLGSNTNYLLALRAQGVDVIIPTWLYFIMNLTFLCSVCCSFSLAFFAGRNNFAALIKLITQDIKKFLFESSHNDIQGNTDTNEQQSEQARKTRKSKQKILFYTSTFLLYILIFVIAITIGDLGKIFNLIGSINANTIGFILPPLFYFRLIMKLNKKRTANFYISIVMFSIFLPFGILTLVAKYIPS